MKIVKAILLVSQISQINSVAFYVGPRFGLDLSTITLRGKLNNNIKNIKNIISSEKNEGKLSNRINLGLSLESFFSLGICSLGFCLDAGKSFRNKNKVKTSIKTYMIKANSWNLGLTGVVGLNFSLFRFLIFAGPHGQYIQYSDDKINETHKEWQWIPMLGFAPQIRLGIMVLELRYLHPVQINLFTQGSESISKRVTFNKKGAGLLSIAALVRV